MSSIRSRAWALIRRSIKKWYLWALRPQALGIKLSDRDLTRILLGIPKCDIQRDPEGRIISALIDDYTVSYAGFKVYNGYALPTSLTITGLDRTIKIRVNAVNEVK